MDCIRSADPMGGCCWCCGFCCCCCRGLLLPSHQTTIAFGWIGDVLVKGQLCEDLLLLAGDQATSAIAIATATHFSSRSSDNKYNWDPQQRQ